MTVPTVIPQFVHDAAATFPSACFGLDISKWQPDIDGAQIQADGVRFVILKGSQSSFADPLFEHHAQELTKKAPLVAIGAYHLCVCVSGSWDAIAPVDPVAQGWYAADFVKTMRARGVAFRARQWLDLEPDSEGKPPRFFSALVKGAGRRKAAEWVGAWLSRAEETLGEQFGVYFSPRLAKEGGEELRRVIGDRPTWWAFYQREPKLPRTVAPGGVEGWDWTLWQYKADDNKATKDLDESGRCRGVMRGKKACDLNVVNPLSDLYSELMK